MQWAVRLETRTSAGEVKTTELVMISRPVVVSTLAEVGLMLDETEALLAKLQALMLCGQVAAHAAHHRACAACGVMQPLKDRRTRRLQTLFGTVEVEAPRFRVCRCRPSAPMAAAVTASPANQESVRIRTHAVALQLEASDRQAAAEVAAVGNAPDKAAAADASRPAVMLDGAYIRAVPGHQVRNFEATTRSDDGMSHAKRERVTIIAEDQSPSSLHSLTVHSS